MTNRIVANVSWHAIRKWTRKWTGLALMPFGNSWSENFETHGACPRLVFEQPQPAAHRLAHRLRTTPGPAPPPRHITSGPFQEAFGQLALLPPAQQVPAQRQRQPQGPHQLQRLDETHPQGRHFSSLRPHPLARQQHAGQHHRRDFLRARFQRVALEHFALAVSIPGNTIRAPTAARKGRSVPGPALFWGPPDWCTTAIPAGNGRPAAPARGSRAVPTTA